MNTISNMDDLIDSRDVIARIEELEGERETLKEGVEEAQEALDEALAEAKDKPYISNEEEVQEAGEELKKVSWALHLWDDSDEAEELKALKALQDEAEGYSSDWNYGATLIRDSYFKDYAMELAEEIGAISNEAQWPNNCIDWDQAARELQYDYTSIEFDGVDYWVR